MFGPYPYSFAQPHWEAKPYPQLHREKGGVAGEIIGQLESLVGEPAERVHSKTLTHTVQTLRSTFPATQQTNKKPVDWRKNKRQSGADTPP